MKNDKYDGKNATEMKSIAKSRDNKIAKQQNEIAELEGQTDYLSAVLDQLPEAATKARLVRGGTALTAAALISALEKLKPGLKSIAGTPVSLRHLLTIAGVSAAYYFGEDEATANTSVPDIAEGVAMPGLVSIGESVGARIAA